MRESGQHLAKDPMSIHLGGLPTTLASRRRRLVTNFRGMQLAGGFNLGSSARMCTGLSFRVNLAMNLESIIESDLMP